MSSNLLEEPVELRDVHVTLSAPQIAESPEKGIICFHYERGEITVRSMGRGKPYSASADFHLTKIHSVEEHAVEDEKDANEDYLDKLLNEAQNSQEEAE